MERIHAISQSALIEMREQLYHLRPTVLNEDLVEALTQHCQELRRIHALTIEFEANVEGAFSVNQRDNLYYIAREALWNVVKHALASHISIVLSSESDHIVLSIKDDGVGFNPADYTGGKTMGLRNMEERAKLLGGTFELKSKSGQGTQVTARIPVPTAQQS